MTNSAIDEKWKFAVGAALFVMAMPMRAEAYEFGWIGVATKPGC